jgi:hypothetical protein
MKRYLLVSLVLVSGIALGFQNCTKTQFNSDASDLSTKVGGVTAGVVTDSGNAVAINDEDAEAKLSEILGKQIHWVMISFQVDGAQVSLPPEHFFRFRLHAQSLDGISCAGSCPEDYQVEGQSFCSPINGQFVRGFDENAGEVINKFVSLQETVEKSCETPSAGQLNDDILKILKSGNAIVTYTESNSQLRMEIGNAVFVFQAQN